MTLVDNVLAGGDGATTVGIWLQADHDQHHTAVIRHNTVHNAKGRGVRFEHTPSWPTIRFRDNLIDGASNECLKDLGSGVRTISTNQTYACSGGIPHLVTSSPSLSYLLRVDQGGGKGTARDGSDGAATVFRRYVKEDLTDDDLWPLPKEGIRDDFCAAPDNRAAIKTRGHNTCGWCASGKSLTRPIWEQLGVPSPY